MSVKSDIRFRVYILYILFSIFALAIIGKIVYTQTVKGNDYRQLSRDRYIDEEELEPVRGNIYSDDRSLLSTTLPVFDIFWDSQTLQKEDTFRKYIKPLSEGLSSIIGDRSSAEYEQALRQARKKQKRYFLVKSRVSFEQYLKVKELPIFRLGKNKGGMRFVDHNKRANPFGLLANRTVGKYMSGGKSVGLESYYNEYLQGKYGSRLVQLVAGGTRMPLDGSELEPENGKDIHTSIDVNLQEVAENSLLDMLYENNADFGTCIVMEVSTGRLKALANLGKQKDGSYWEDYNYALLKQYPGSTFKLVSLMALLEDSVMDIDDNVHVGDGVMATRGGSIRDDHGGAADISLKHAFAVSSNVAFAKTIYDHYKNRPDDFIKFLNRIGLDKNSGVDLVGEPKPYFRSPEDERWSPYTLAYLAHGYEMQITPMKMCQIYNAVANNGILMRPYITQDVNEYGNVIKQFRPDSIRQICSQSTVNKIKECMAEVVRVGTGTKLQNPFYQIGGKTGTAKWVDAHTSFSDNVYAAFFIGFFPLDNPRYTIAVSVKMPKGASQYYGSQVALPVFKSVADRIYAREVAMIDMHNNWYSVQSEKVESSIAANKDREILTRLLGINTHYNIISGYDETKVSRGKANYTVPDVKGMGLKDALYVLENTGFITSHQGQGKVIEQSLQPNTQGYYGQKIEIILN